MGTLKDVVDLTTQLANSVSDRKISAELNKIQQLTLQLQSEQIGLHESNIELREQNLKLREEISELKKKADEFSDFKFDGYVYWKHDGEGEKEGPFCPRCHDAKKLAVRLHPDGHNWWCNECKDSYGPDGHPPAYML